MVQIENFKDAYPEQLVAALRDEIRREEREQQARDAAKQRRRERWAVVRARVGQLLVAVIRPTSNDGPDR